MATISENLQTIKNSTDAIKQAIIDKGGTVSGDITTWADAIDSIQGGSSGGAGSVFKITNKLNGQLFGGPTYMNGNSEHIHTYNFENGVLDSIILLPVNSIEVSDNIFPNPLLYTFGGSSGMHGVAANSRIRCGCLMVSLKNDGFLYFDALDDGDIVDPIPLEVAVIAFDTNKNYDIDFFKVQSGGPCFVKNTRIKLKDYTEKLVQDINYNDELLVWNFDEGKYDTAKPLWIKKEQIETYYYKVILSNGVVFKCTGPQGHRMFNVTKQSFEYPMNCVNDDIYTIDGIVTVLSCEKIEETVEYYNIITDYHINCFADGILTSCRYNNLYQIEDMRFVKDDRLNRAPKWKLYEQFRDYPVLARYIEGLRLYEQLDIPLEDTIKYCERLESLRKTLDEFSDNKTMLSKIEDTQVGWIDRNGKAYGFKLYMPGQNNHIILANRICQILNVKSDNPSRYLEKLGWVKYTTDFILNSDDEYINKKQLNTIKKFLNVPGKCKKDGFIKIGTTFDDYTSISDFENMDEYSFEFRKKNNKRNNRVCQQEKLKMQKTCQPMN